MLTLEESIKLHAERLADKTAVICGNESLSYSELWKAIQERAEELKKDGLKAGRPYVYCANQDADFIINYCAIHWAKAIAVPLEHKAPEVKINAVKRQVESCEFAEDIRDILYTTGTTGNAKGVMLSETAITACADNLISALEFSEDLLFIISGPLNHIASLCKIQPVLSAGGTICILDGIKDLNAFFDVFTLPYKKFATFMVPASLRLIMQFSYEKLCSLADKIDFIETGAAPITGHDMERLSKALPKSRLYNTMGGTEVGAVCSYNFNDGKYMEGCIGRPMKNSVIEINSEGEIIISGKTIMSGYVGDEENTEKVLKDGKIHGSDLGYVDTDGLIHLKGRKGDVINVGGFKVDPSEVENAASSHPAVKDCICVAGTHPVIGTVLRLLVVTEDGMELDKKSIALHIKERLEPHKIPTLYESVDSIKRTYNGKLDRKYYK